MGRMNQPMTAEEKASNISVDIGGLVPPMTIG
jgi:hypothetical protein